MEIDDFEPGLMGVRDLRSKDVDLRRLSKSMIAAPSVMACWTPRWCSANAPWLVHSLKVEGRLFGRLLSCQRKCLP